MGSLLVEEFLEGLRAGEPRAVQAVQGLLGTMAHKAPRRTLTPREQEVLESAARGLSDQQIALELGIKPYTVKSYWRDLKQALQAANRVHAIVLWLATQRADGVSRPSTPDADEPQDRTGPAEAARAA